jgi:hypothetical protein
MYSKSMVNRSFDPLIAIENYILLTIQHSPFKG